mmetsp:Transcript_64736/g.208479  ORF Transcript_64736/g.208479 Transcript_64736/m.208479 type:complete len:459 (-) Transcript_64736:184-1560(-)
MPWQEARSGRLSSAGLPFGKCAGTWMTFVMEPQAASILQSFLEAQQKAFQAAEAPWAGGPTNLQEAPGAESPEPAPLRRGLSDVTGQRPPTDLQLCVKNTFIHIYEDANPSKQRRARSQPARSAQASRLMVALGAAGNVEDSREQRARCVSDYDATMGQRRNAKLMREDIGAGGRPALPQFAASPGEAISGAGSVASPSTSVADEDALFSVGTRGHPFSCAKACKYIRKKTGCREGANCPDCHRCCWHRTTSRAQQGLGHLVARPMEEEGERAAGLAVEISVGTWGHPNCCAPPCKYVRRKSGCRQGRACANCHECRWQRTPLQGQQRPQASTDPEVLQPEMDVPPPPPPPLAMGGRGRRDPTALCKALVTVSQGTVGHPHTCGPPCRYARRGAGCRGGASCRWCHECPWRAAPTKVVFDKFTPADTFDTSDDRGTTLADAAAADVRASGAATSPVHG